ncbi:MAG: hypothetical protein AB7S41_01685 [Parvibaculaceae bacterium]
MFNKFALIAVAGGIAAGAFALQAEPAAAGVHIGIGVPAPYYYAPPPPVYYAPPPPAYGYYGAGYDDDYGYRPRQKSCRKWQDRWGNWHKKCRRW